MKKLLTIIMVAAMLMTMSLSAFAAPTDLSGAITDLGLSLPVVRALDVPVNMQVDVGMTGSYVEGPVVAETHEYSENANYRAIIYMTDVILGAVLLLIVGGAICYIRREKKKGVRCIGCPSAGACAKRQQEASESGCSGCCSSYKSPF